MQAGEDPFGKDQVLLQKPPNQQGVLACDLYSKLEGESNRKHFFCNVFSLDQTSQGSDYVVVFTTWSLRLPGNYKEKNLDVILDTTSQMVPKHAQLSLFPPPKSLHSSLLDNFLTGRLATSLMVCGTMLPKLEYVSVLQTVNGFPLNLKCFFPGPQGPILLIQPLALSPSTHLAWTLLCRSWPCLNAPRSLLRQHLLHIPLSLQASAGSFVLVFRSQTEWKASPRELMTPTYLRLL